LSFFLSQGTSPTISIDNTSGCQLYLSKDSLGASITSAKSSEINVMVPSGGSDGDWVRPAPYICTFGCIRKLNVVTNG
jgi:adenylyl cyclase-associated protein